MTPYLVTAPSGSLVERDDIKAYLRVDHDDDDAVIDALSAAAVAYLDGWRGALCRAILPQTWAIDVDAAGEFTLPLPDVTEATADHGGGEVAIEVTPGAAGPRVTVTDACTIRFDCEMSESHQAIARVIAFSLIAHWFETREAVQSGNGLAEVPMHAAALIQSLRFRPA